jgi:hypothetical protein
MSLADALARIEINALSNPDRTCADAVKDLDHISTLQEDGIGGAFEKSLRVKSTIDTLETQAELLPDWETLAAITNSEYRLWILNAQTPLHQNPFLVHWVETIQRLETEAKSHNGQAATHDISAEDVAATRLGMIKRLLRGQDTSILASQTPRQLYNARHARTPFDVQPYVRMLEDAGIYEPSPSLSSSVEAQPKVTYHALPTVDGETTTEPIKKEEESNNNAPRKLTFQQWKDDLLSRLKTDPTSAFEDLTHLPIALPALDFLTTLITNHTLDVANLESIDSIDSKLVVTTYIQHALRLVEYMGQPSDAHTHIDPPRQTNIGIDIDTSMLDRGREAQSRAIRLLLLFMKNLIKRGLVGVEPTDDITLYYEIQEICVGYVWMREVREFRVWLDELVRE